MYPTKRLTKKQKILNILYNQWKIDKENFKKQMDIEDKKYVRNFEWKLYLEK